MYSNRFENLVSNEHRENELEKNWQHLSLPSDQARAVRRLKLYIIQHADCIY